MIDDARFHCETDQLIMFLEARIVGRDALRVFSGIVWKTTFRLPTTSFVLIFYSIDGQLRPRRVAFFSGVVTGKPLPGGHWFQLS